MEQIDVLDFTTVTTEMSQVKVTPTYKHIRNISQVLYDLDVNNTCSRRVSQDIICAQGFLMVVFQW